MVACAVKNCPNEGRWYPVVKLAHRSMPSTTIDCCFNLRHCDSCKAQTGLDDILTDEGFDRLSRGLMAKGKAMPTRELTVLDWTLEPEIEFPTMS